MAVDEPHDIQSDRLMRVAAKAFDFEVEISSVERVTERRRGLGRSLKAEHPLVPGFAGQPISLLARLGCPLRRMPDRAAVDCLARLSAHRVIKSQAEAAGKWGHRWGLASG